MKDTDVVSVCFHDEVKCMLFCLRIFYHFVYFAVHLRGLGLDFKYLP